MVEVLVAQHMLYTGAMAESCAVKLTVTVGGQETLKHIGGSATRGTSRMHVA